MIAFNDIIISDGISVVKHTARFCELSHKKAERKEIVASRNHSILIIHTKYPFPSYPYMVQGSRYV